MMRILSSIVLGMFATIAAVMATIGGWHLGNLLYDLITRTGTADVIVVGCVVMGVFLLTTRFFYDHVLIEEIE